MTSPVQKITSLALPELSPYLTLRRPEEHIRGGIFVAEGDKVVRRLLRSEIHVVSLLLTEEWLETLSSERLLVSRPETPVYLGDKKLLSSIVGFNLHQGIMAVAKVPQEVPVDETVQRCTGPHLFVALDGLVNSENVGLVVRNCAAFGVDGVIVGETSGSPYLRRAVRNSMGTVFSLAVHHSENLARSLEDLRAKYGTEVVAADPKEKMPLAEVPLAGNVCIVLGNEGAGISPKVVDACSVSAAIPMLNGTDSLNVASASAVFLYEAAKQRART